MRERMDGFKPAALRVFPCLLVLLGFCRGGFRFANRDIAEHDAAVLEELLQKRFEESCELQDYVAAWCHELKIPLSASLLINEKLQDEELKRSMRCQVILKLGFDREVLKQSIQAELAAAYGITFFVMAVSSVFSVKALGNMMFTDLTGVNLASLGAALMIFFGWYVLSVKAYERIAVSGGGTQD